LGATVEIDCCACDQCGESQSYQQVHRVSDACTTVPGAVLSATLR
jgi:hypothetical protein